MKSKPKYFIIIIILLSHSFLLSSCKLFKDCDCPEWKLGKKNKPSAFLPYDQPKQEQDTKTILL